MARQRVDLGSPTLNQAFDELRNDYSISKRTRFNRTRSGVGSTGTSGDYQFRSESDFIYAMELSRDIDRNDIVVGQAVDRLVDNIVQDGFGLDTQTGDAGLDDDLAARWQEWATNPDACDLAGEHDFHTLEKLTLRSMIVDGDIFHLPIADAGALESCEAHRCRTPNRTKQNVVLGVLLDETTRRRLEYWLTKEDVGLYGTIKVADVSRYPARQRDPVTGRDERVVFHCYHPRRLSQTRGFTAFAPLAMATEHHDDLQFAQLIKARVAASFAILEEMPLGMPGGAGPRTGEQTSDPLADGTSRTLEGLGPGMRYRSRPGGKLTGFTPNVPNPEFFPHSMLILTFISINLGLPVQLLLLDPKQTNFSGWRGAMDQARLGFRKFQNWLTTSFHSNVYRWKVRQWIADDRMLETAYDRLGTSIFKHRFNPPRWPYIEPMTDASAGILRVRNYQTSQRRLAAENGVDWWQVADENVEDNAYAILAAKKKAAEINLMFPEDALSWRDVLCLPTPDRVSGSISTATTSTVVEQAEPEASNADEG
jgi:lambda family phage portal protein